MNVVRRDMDNQLLQIEADLNAQVMTSLREMPALNLLAVLSKISGRLSVAAQTEGRSAEDILNVMAENHAAAARVAVAQAVARRKAQSHRTTPTKEKTK